MATAATTTEPILPPPSMRHTTQPSLSAVGRAVSFGETKKYEYDETMSTNRITEKLKTWFAPILQPVVHCGGGGDLESRVDDTTQRWDLNSLCVAVEDTMCGADAFASSKYEDARDEVVNNPEERSANDNLEVTVENVLEYETLKELNMLPKDQLEREFYKQADVLCKMQQQHGSAEIQVYEKEIRALKQYLEFQKASGPTTRALEKKAMIQQRMAKTIDIIKAAAATQEQIETDFEFSQKEATQKKSTFSVVEKDAAEDLVKPPPLQHRMRVTKREAAADDCRMATYKTPAKYRNDDVADASEEPVQCIERPQHARRPPALTTAMRIQQAIFGKPATEEPTPKAMDDALKRAWNEINELVADLKFSLINDDDETALDNGTSTHNAKTKVELEDGVAHDNAEPFTEFPVESPKSASSPLGDKSAKSKRSISASVKAAARALLRRSVKVADGSVKSGLSKKSLENGVPAVVDIGHSNKGDNGSVNAASFKEEASVMSISVGSGKSAAAASIKEEESIKSPEKAGAVKSPEASSSVKLAGVASVHPDSVKATAVSDKTSVADGGSVVAASVKSTTAASVKSTGAASVKSEAAASVKSEAAASVKSTTAASVKSTTAASVKSTTAASVKSTAAASVKSTAAASVKSTAAASVKSTAAASVKSTAAESVKSAAAASVKSEAAASVKSEAAASVKSTAAASVKSTAVASVKSTTAASVKSTAAASVKSTSGASVKSGTASVKSLVKEETSDNSVLATSVKEDTSVAVASVKSGAASVKSASAAKAGSGAEGDSGSVASKRSIVASVKSAFSRKSGGSVTSSSSKQKQIVQDAASVKSSASTTLPTTTTTSTSTKEENLVVDEKDAVVLAPAKEDEQDTAQVQALSPIAASIAPVAAAAE